ncbi:MAG: hypothetical protein AB7V00_04400 [Bacilli bacterium]
MKPLKIMLLIFLSLLLTSTFSLTVNADVGPKPFVNMEIIGMGDQTYTATLISKEASGPNFFYEDYLEFGDPWMDYHPIMEYEDSEGYRWIGQHWELSGDDEFSWSYYPPDNFKLIIMTDNDIIFTTGVLERYAFGSYFQADVSSAVDGVISNLKIIEAVTPNYDFLKEIAAFMFRLLLTLAIEVGIALLFGFRKKKELYAIFFVNIITLVFLNAMLNITTYYHGEFLAVAFYIIGELIVFIVESVFYVFYFYEHRLKAFLYGLIANISSFAAGFFLYLLERAIT